MNNMETVAHCNMEKNARLIAQILDFDVNGMEYDWYEQHLDLLEKHQPHWVSVEEPPKGNGAFAACCVYDGKIYWCKAIYLDGKWLREMDGVELPVNYWMEIPEPPQEVQE